MLVNRRHVVTAGHCVKNKLLNSISVTLGEYHLKSSREPLPSQTYRVIFATVHPKFQFSPAADRFDVAVLRLDRPVRYAPHIAPICLPEIGRDPSPGTQAYVAGKKPKKDMKYVANLIRLLLFFLIFRLGSLNT